MDLAIYVTCFYEEGCELRLQRSEITDDFLISFKVI